MFDVDLIALLLCVAIVVLLAAGMTVAVWGSLAWLCRGIAGTWRAFWADPPTE